MGDRSSSSSSSSGVANYKFVRTLGIGSFSKVKLAKHVQTHQEVAIKILNRELIKHKDMEEKIIREIKIMRSLVHPHIIQLYDVIETPTTVYLVMEYAPCGKLFDYILQKTKLQEDEARKLFQQLISAIEYCHGNNIVHRDLKPENLLLDCKYNVKISDFGLSNIKENNQSLKTACGSPYYVAPEVISKKSYGLEVDIWSCGIILYVLLCGRLPFEDESYPVLFNKIRSGICTIPSSLSPGAIDLIKRILVVDPTKRMTIDEIHQHSWFQVPLPHYVADFQRLGSKFLFG